MIFESFFPLVKLLWRWMLHYISSTSTELLHLHKHCERQQQRSKRLSSFGSHQQQQQQQGPLTSHGGTRIGDHSVNIATVTCPSFGGDAQFWSVGFPPVPLAVEHPLLENGATPSAEAVWIETLHIGWQRARVLKWYF